MNPNLAAFLTMVSHSEGTDLGADPYRVCYGYAHTIQSFADHPYPGEWLGESLASIGRPGEISTAAGRYQINHPWFLRGKAATGVPDFTPASQDAIATWLITQNLALHPIEAGDIATAIVRCRSIWASLPGGSSGQPEKSLSTLLAAYTAAGGTLNA